MSRAQGEAYCADMITSVLRRVVLIVLAALGVILASVASPAIAATPPYKITVVNSTGQDPASVFVTLLSSGSAPTAPSTLPSGFAMNTAYALDPIGGATPWVSEGGNRYSITVSGAWKSGTVLYSIGQGFGSKPTAGQNSSAYDFSEVTVDDGTGALNGDISSVDQIGVPARLSVLAPGRVIANRDGTSQPATEYVGCVNATWSLLQRYAGSTPSGTYRTSGGRFIELLGPSAGGAWANYPSFQTYVTNQARSGLTVTGNFGGNSQYGTPASTYAYSGSLTPDGRWLKLTGTLGNATGYPTPMDIYVPLSELWSHDDTVWTGANGYGVYRQNGPYTLVPQGGAQPGYGATAFYNTAPPYPSAGDAPPAPLSLGGYTPVNPPAGNYGTDANDIYGWIYGDLVASFAMGYWGSNYGSNSVAWNTNADPPWGAGAAGKAPFAAAWTNPFLGYPLFNVYQAAVDATGTTYGSPLNDRFTPPQTTSPELGVTPAASAGPYTWEVELLADDGCAQALSISPASGPATGGQRVTITGRNFHDGATVTFDGAAGTNPVVNHNSSTNLDTITVTTPRAPSAGPVNVRVTNAYGSAAQGIDTSVLTRAYAYPTASGAAAGSASGAAAGSASGARGPVPTGGIAIGAGAYRYPGGGCALRQVVGRPLQARLARAPRVVVPTDGIVALSVKGLPRRAETSVDVRVGTRWVFLGRVKSNARGEAVLPRYLQSTRGQALVIRTRSGRKGVRYLRTVAGAPRDWSGRALGSFVRAYPVGTCPVHRAVARKPVAARLAASPLAVVPLAGPTTVRVRGLRRNERAVVSARVGGTWRFVGRIRATRAGVAMLPPISVDKAKMVIPVRVRGDRLARFVRLRAS